MAVQAYVEENKCDCGHRLWIGTRAIGPEYVICKKCRTLQRTGLGVEGLTNEQKILKYFGSFWKEFFAPTFWGMNLFILRFWINCIPHTILVFYFDIWYNKFINPVYLDNYLKDPYHYVDPIHNTYFGICLLIWPTFLIIRYLMMVRNSEKHQDKNNPANW